MTGFAGGRRPRKSDPRTLRPSIYGPSFNTQGERMTRRTTIKVTVELEHVSGPEQDAETLLDFFAARIGDQNGAGKQALTLSITSWDDPTSVYKVYLVDQA